MSERPPLIHGLEFQSRALAARAAETDRIQFLCGTLTIRNENQIHLVDYDDETGVLNKMVYPYPNGEIWDLATSHVDKDLIAVCYGGLENGEYVRHACLAKLDGQSPDETDVGTIETLGMFETADTIHRVCWHPSGFQNQLVTVNDKAGISLWSIDGDKPQEMSKLQLDSRGRLNYSALCWNSHHNYNQVFITADSALFSWDIRTKSTQLLLDHYHGPCVRCIDCNPNRPYYFVSGGDDCNIQFWDWRKLEKPLLSRQDHSHWVWSVQYNFSYDQLVLSGSSDSQVILSRIASIASEPLRHLDDENQEPVPTPNDEVIAVYEEHEDSVYNVRWSTTDAWVFASLSYDGRLVINHVPSNEKFAILTA